MEQKSPFKTHKSSSTQTEFTSNKGRGLEPVDPSKHVELFNAYQDTPLSYRESLTKVFTEQFIAEASQKVLKVIIGYVITQKEDDLKKVNPLYYGIRGDRSVTPTNCLLYGNRLVIPSCLKN